MCGGYNQKVTYLRISVTDRCNLRCKYCMPAGGVKLKTHDDILSYEEITQICRAAAELGVTKLRLTGGEPLVRKNLPRLVRMLKGVHGIRELCLSTNGTLLDRFAEELKAAGLSRINISLDTLNPHKYREMTRGGDIQKVMDGIDAAQKAGFSQTKINMVLIPGFNTNEVEDMRLFCKKKGLTLQRINKYSLRSGSEQKDYMEAERPPDCRICNRLRLTADGMLKPCLLSGMEIPVDFDDIKSSLRKAIAGKSKCKRDGTERGNWEIGG